MINLKSNGRLISDRSMNMKITEQNLSNASTVDCTNNVAINWIIKEKNEMLSNLH